MNVKLILLAGCAMALASPAAAAPGHCFTATGQPIGPVYDTERPDTPFLTWVQARGGECRALRADEVTLYRGQPNDYPMEFRRTDIQERPLDVAPGAPRSSPEAVPPPGATLTWQGDPAIARRMIIMHYQATTPDVRVTDTGRVVAMSQGGAWRIYETITGDGTRREVAVQLRPDKQYVLMESGDGGRWGEVIELDE